MHLAFQEQFKGRAGLHFLSPPPRQDFLEEAPMSWDALVKKTFRKKEEILPMQMAEVRQSNLPSDRMKEPLRA